MPRISNVVSLCGAPSDTGTVKPPALSLSVGPYAPGDLHHPPIRGIADMRGAGHDGPLEKSVFGMRDMDQPCGRYYPLRFPTVPPAATNAQPRDEVHQADGSVLGEHLSGIWLASYGLFGTEVLFLEWVEEERMLKAWKITGDVQVPRGVVSWTALSSTPVVLDETASQVLGNVPLSTRAFSGRGTSSNRGFMYVYLPCYRGPADIPYWLIVLTRGR